MKMIKTSIPIPDTIFFKAEELAKSLNIPISDFYTKALSTYIELCKKNISVTEKLNEVYQSESSALHENILKLQATALKDEQW